MKGKLLLKDGSEFEGISFGAPKSAAGEMVFSTGMVGYPESFTDPSYCGQILIFTYPLIGNYGVPDPRFWESDRMQISGLIVSQYIDTPSHFQSKMTLAQWLKESKVPALEISDTRLLAQKLRDKGAMLGKIVIDPFDKTFTLTMRHRNEQGKKDIDWYDPNSENVVANVSTKEVIDESPRGLNPLRGSNPKTVILIDCGAKRNITQSLLKRGVRVITIPWDFNPFADDNLAGYEAINLRGWNGKFDALVISNGPGDPKMAAATIKTINKALTKRVPTLGICLGHQLLTLAAGGNTGKLKFGHRSQNQPCIQVDTHYQYTGISSIVRDNQDARCFITTQNHGFAVSKIPKGFREWFINANDGSNEGLIHEKLPLMSVQFHPESTPGPYDTEWIFDFFLGKLSNHNQKP